MNYNSLYVSLNPESPFKKVSGVLGCSLNRTKHFSEKRLSLEVKDHKHDMFQDFLIVNPYQNNAIFTENH